MVRSITITNGLFQILHYIHNKTNLSYKMLYEDLCNANH